MTEEQKIEILALVKRHNERVDRIVKLSKEVKPPRDIIRGEIYESAFDIGAVKAFGRSNPEGDKIQELIASAENRHQEIFSIIRRLKIGR